MVLTTTTLFLHTLAQVGIDHVFVNWGSDHPAMLEELARQRATHGAHALTIMTSPNEMVALSAAQGYAQVTGKPAAVIVHVDVGTQALAGAVHNADKGRAPILIYAGAVPFTTEGPLRGTRNEWIQWIQDTHDQPAIVRQYMRYVAQIGSPASLPHQVRRALQIATSEPRGPVYLWARREIMEQEIDPSLLEAHAALNKWPSVQPTALPAQVVRKIAEALLGASLPLLITSHLGRNPEAFSALGTLSRLLALPVFLTCPSVTNLPSSNPYLVGCSFLNPGSHTLLLNSADVVLVVDVEVPWIPMNKDKEGACERPGETAQMFVIDSGDPLKRSIGMYHDGADLVCHADAAIALTQLREAIGAQTANGWSQRTERILKLHREWKEQLHAAELFYTAPSSSNRTAPYTTPQVVGTLRKAIRARRIPRESTLVLNESTSEYGTVWSHMRLETAGEIISSGGSSLGWALGAGIGSVLGGHATKKGKSGTGYELVAAVVGDGTFLFGVPASAFWMARRYQTPFLVIVLNNGGWKSPKLSMLGVHPTGYGANAIARGDQLTVEFGPECPDYAQIAVAASNGWVWGRKIGVDLVAGEERNAERLLQDTIAEAVRVVVEDRRCAVVDCVLERI